MTSAAVASAKVPIAYLFLVLLARQRGWPVLTSDLADLRAIARTLDLHEILTRSGAWSIAC